MSTNPPIIEMGASFAPEARLLETPATNALDRATFWILMALLIFGPLAFGATEPWSVAIQHATAVLLLVLWNLRQAVSGAAVIQPGKLFLPMGLFAAVVVFQLTFRATAYHHASFVEAADYVTYAVLIFVATQIFFYGQRLRLFAEVLAWFGLAVSLFAILQSLSSNGLLYWVRAPRYSSSIYGPYVNRNHYAGLMEMLAPFALAICFSRRAGTGKKLIAGFAALLMSASIFLSTSRGGTAAFIAELIFLGVINASLRKRSIPGWKSFFFFISLAIFLVWIDVSPALMRWTSMEGDLQTGRAAIVHDCWRMFLQKPITGWGLGTFPFVYPQFRSFYTDYFINQVHNDYVQIFVETGIIGGIAMLLFIFALYRESLNKLAVATKRPSLDGGATYRLAALTGCTGILVHSFVDFNLHIPANAALFFVLCAVACWGPAHVQEPDEPVSAI